MIDFNAIQWIQQKNEVRRSDFYRSEAKSKTDFIPSRRLEDIHGNDNQFLQEIEPEDTTTDSSEDYLSHDTESVDRLALDGETRDPIDSSTIDAYNY